MSGEPHVRIDRGRLEQRGVHGEAEHAPVRKRDRTEPARPTDTRQASRLPYHSNLWGSARSLFPEGDPAAEAWVRDRAMAVLEGKARDVAAGIRRRATTEGLTAAARKGADECATYLANKAGYLDYPKALSSGWPIATGVIEGAVRHVCKDRMDVTGARWSVDGAEAVLKIRALRSNGDFDAYWRWHRSRERQRVHEARYHENVIPAAA